MRDYEEIELYKSEHPQQKIKTVHEGFQERFTRSSCDVAFGGGVLSPQPVGSKILTPHGFEELRNVKPGDVVMGLGVRLQKLIHVTNMGMQDCIRITLEDGSVAESAMSHKWWVLRDGKGEMSEISFELLEAFQTARERHVPMDTCLFRCKDGVSRPIRISNIEDIGKKECICVGVSGEDETYITDNYIVTQNCGKSQPYSSEIMTPTGYRRIGDLKVGDIVNDAKGGTQVVEEIYEKGHRYVMTMVLDNGDKVCSCEEHLWLVFDSSDNSYKYLTTGQIMRGAKYRYFIPCCGEQEYEIEYDKTLYPSCPFPPYELGRLLGMNIDLTSFSGRVSEGLNKMGIRRNFNKWIPRNITCGNLATRKEFMNGMMDSLYNQCASKEGKINRYYTLGNKKFWKSLDLVVSSLGGKTILSNSSVNNVVDITIMLPCADDYITNRKNAKDKFKTVILRSIASFYPMKDTRPCRCIRVSGKDHLYVTNSFTVTHNTYAAILMVAEPSLDPNFRAAFTRRNLGNLKQGGGIVDDFRNAYGDFVDITTSENPRVTFPSGAYIDCLHIANEATGPLMERAKGWQYDLFYMDELTSYEFSTFSIVGTRVRGKSKYSGSIRGTTNPKKSHWTRKMLDWYVGLDGFIDPERDGVVRYYYQMGDFVEDLVWGATKEEVYRLCKGDIDRKLQRLSGEKWDYRNMIRSFVFYAGKMAENKAMVENNANYVGSVTAVGGKRAQQLIEGNFNVDEDESDDIPIPSRDAQAVFTNDEARNGDHWITVDLADVGTDNVVALYWDGFHVEDALVIESSTPRMNYEKVKSFANHKGVGERHIIYDATRATYMYDYMPEAVPFISASSAIGLDQLKADRLKDECYLRLCSVIKGGNISFSPDLARRVYNHQKIKTPISFQQEFLDETGVVRFKEKGGYGKVKLLSKKEMNAELGQSRSMDLLDNFSMRMLPVLNLDYGSELGSRDVSPFKGNARRAEDRPTDIDIYDDTFWA